ncbi:MAG: alpha-galactosidase [Clostridia bacterium]|nr:alpha-galactosidase [Clostridia bacterium]
MAILFDEKKKLFTLSTRNTTYQMKVDMFGVLNHIYYGEKVGQEDMSYLLDYRDSGFSGNLYEAENQREYSLDTRPQEYSTNGVGDYRINSVSVINPDGTDAVDMRYVSYEIVKGKYSIPGMPALYGDEKDAETLAITVKDAVTGLEAVLFYSVWEERDIITRCVKFKNSSNETIVLKKAASMNLDLMRGDWQLVHFHGRHCMERQMERVPVINGRMSIESVRGASSHHHNPFTILCAGETTEEFGPCYGTALVYSGNFAVEVEKDQMGQTRLTAGISTERFSWELKTGEEFYTPEAVMTFSSEGFGKMSSNFHHTFREHLCRGKYVHERRPVLINNWEATYFTFDNEKIISIAEGAAKLGVEMLVLDDGWFGKRDDDLSGLGDWIVNTEKLKGGLKPIADGINALGMKFGLWFEPECISEDSDLYRAHPDWAIQIPGRKPSRSRYQLILDMSREDVREYLFKKMTQVLDSANIEYVKWDMNRHISDVYSAKLPKERQGEVCHRYMLGLYELLEKLVTRYPDILWEGCSGGGGRFDLGMLYYSPQIWCSDDTDAVERVKIQYGTSFAYPISTVGSHVSAVPNHQTGRNTLLETRGNVAMAGSFGYELDLNLLSDEEKEEVKEQIKKFKKYYTLTHEGEYYRLTNPFENHLYAAWEFVAPDQSEALIHGVQTMAQPNSPSQNIPVKGLDPEKMYEVNGSLVRSGRALMAGGLNLPRQEGDYLPVEFYIKEV